MPSFTPGADQVEARERLRVLVDGALAKLEAGLLPDAVEREEDRLQGRRRPTRAWRHTQCRQST